MKNTIKFATAMSAVLISSTALGVAGLDRLVFTPSFLFEKGNYAELTLARADPTVRRTSNRQANVAEVVDTLKFAYKHQFNDKFGLGLMFNNQPIGVDVNYFPASTPLAGSVSAKSYIALGHFKATERISAFAGLKHQSHEGNADLTLRGLPGKFNFDKDSDTGFIVGGAYSIPKIALRASLYFESGLDFSHKTTNSNPVSTAVYNGPITPGQPFLGGGNTTSATPDAITLELQSGIAKNTLLFGSIRYSKWEDAQVSLAGVRELSTFNNTTVFKLGVGRKFSDSISGSVTLNYEKSTGEVSSPFSPQDGEKGIALGLKFTAKDGFTTSIGAQYRELGDTTTSIGDRFERNHVVTVGLKLSKSF